MIEKYDHHDSGYDLFLRYNAKGKIEAASMKKANETETTKNNQDSSIDDIRDIERIGRIYGLDNYLHERKSRLDMIASQGIYDLRGSGNGDIPLPENMRRRLHNGESPTRSTPLINQIY